MSNNPFSRFVVDPSKVPNPNTMQAREFENYTSTEMRKIQSSLRVYRRSAIYLAGCFGMMLVAGYLSNRAGRHHILGSDSNLFCNLFRSRWCLFGFENSS